MEQSRRRGIRRRLGKRRIGEGGQNFTKLFPFAQLCPKFAKTGLVKLVVGELWHGIIFTESRHS